MPVQAPGRGRPRDRNAEESILAATLALLAEHGYEGLTTDAIAARAGVSKATIYRRWSSKDDVVLAAAATLAEDVPAPDTGSLDKDLAALADGLVAVFSEDGIALLVAAMVDQMARKPAFAAAVRDGFVGARRQVARTVLERARDRGEIDADDRDLDVAVDLLGAGFYYRLLVTGAPIDHDLGDRLTAATLAWLQTRPAAQPGATAQPSAAR